MPAHAVDNNDGDAQEKTDTRYGPDNSYNLRAQPGIPPVNGLQDNADLSHLGPGAGCPHLRKSLSLHQKGSGEDCWQIVPARPVVRCPPGPGNFPDRDRFPGQEGLVHQYVIGYQEDPVCRHAIAFCKNDHVAADNFSSGDPDMFAVPDDERPRAREASQRLQRPLGLLLLVDGNADDEDDKAHQHQALGEVTEDKIDEPARNEQDEHRLTDNSKDYPKYAAVFRSRELVVSFGPEFFCSFRAGQAGNQPDIGHGHVPVILPLLVMYRHHDNNSDRGTGHCPEVRPVVFFLKNIIRHAGVPGRIADPPADTGVKRYVERQTI